VAGGTVALEHGLAVHFGGGNAGGALGLGQAGGGRGGDVDAQGQVFAPRSVMTLTDLDNWPALPERLTLSWITPLEPAGIHHGVGGISTVVQPQDGVACKITTSFVETLVKRNANRATAWPLVASALLETASQARMPSGNGSLTCANLVILTKLVGTVLGICADAINVPAINNNVALATHSNCCNCSFISFSINSILCVNS